MAANCVAMWCYRSDSNYASLCLLWEGSTKVMKFQLHLQRVLWLLVPEKQGKQNKCFYLRLSVWRVCGSARISDGWRLRSRGDDADVADNQPSVSQCCFLLSYLLRSQKSSQQLYLYLGRNVCKVSCMMPLLDAVRSLFFYIFYSI